jgi:antibiotic biosynthesis monooxygenase (ABM) superfamily enzyme
MAIAGEPVTVSISRRVRTAHLQEFDQALRTLIEAARRSPGHVIAHVFRGAQNAGYRDFYLLYQFASLDSLLAWERSEQRTRLVSRVDALCDGGARRDLSGLEAWFDLPPHQQPPRRIMALLTLLGIWPLVSLTLWVIGPWTASLPFLMRTAVTSTLLVFGMTYVVMPLMVRFILKWFWTSRSLTATVEEKQGTSA